MNVDSAAPASVARTACQRPMPIPLPARPCYASRSLCGCSSVGRASASQAECRRFEPVHPLVRNASHVVAKSRKGYGFGSRGVVAPGASISHGLAGNRPLWRTVWAHFWAHSAYRVEPFELPSEVGEFEAGVVAIGGLDRGVAHDPLRVERRHAGLREHGAERRPERVEVEHTAATSIARQSLDRMAFGTPASGTSRFSARRVTASSTHSCAPRTAPSQSKSSARASRYKNAADVLRARVRVRLRVTRPSCWE